jgi:hypothetical protein
MKKLFTILALTVMLALGSCKMQWKCECTLTDGTVTDSLIDGGTFHHAKHVCNDMAGKCNLATMDRQ